MNHILVPRAAVPFEAQPSPEQALDHGGWCRARHAVLQSLAEGQLALLVGPGGAGKTLMLGALERTLRRAGVPTRRDGPDTAADPVAADVVRLVDDADDLDDATLLHLARVGRPTVLAIEPRSVGRMVALPCRVAPTTLAPLSPADVGDFVARGIAHAGQPAELFSAEAVAALGFFSQGLPGALSRLAQASFLQAQLEAAARVQPEHVGRAREAMQSAPRPAHPERAPNPEPDGAGAIDPEWPVAPWWRRRPGLLVAGAALILTLGLAAALVPWLGSATLPGDGRAHPAATAGPGAAGASPWVNRRSTELSARHAPEAPPRPGSAAPAVAPVGPSTIPAARPAVPAPLDPVEQRVVPPPDGARIARITVRPPAPDGGAASPPAADRATAFGRTATPPREAAESTPDLVMSGSFRGTTYNQTLGRGGGLQLLVTRLGQGDAVGVQFEAFRGLVGSGQLAGHLSGDGRLVASGTLMMGANPFTAELEGTISGKQLVGTVRYTRVVEPGERASISRGRFRLARD